MKRMVDWEEKMMSVAAKETLIKSVAQPIPTYIMGVLKLPMSVCDDLTRMIRSYWWGVEAGKHKTHWVAWEKMIRLKNHVGLGFRDIRIFNQALLVRQAWRLLKRPNSLCARLLKAKYYRRGNLLDTIFPANASPAWKGIEHGLELLKKGVIWRIGNGHKVKIWRETPGFHVWVDQEHLYRE